MGWGRFLGKLPGVCFGSGIRESCPEFVWGYGKIVWSLSGVTMAFERVVAVSTDGEESEEFFVDSCAPADHGRAKEDDALGWMACDKCHHKYPPKHMKNVPEHPRRRVRPCHIACRWYDKALISLGATDPRKYARRVLRLRGSVDDDPPKVKAAVPCRHFKDPKKLAQIAKYLPERFFIGHKVTFGFMSKEEATALWHDGSKEDSVGFRKVVWSLSVVWAMMSGVCL